MIGLSAGGDKLSQVKLHSTPLKGFFVSIAPKQPFVNTKSGRKPKKFIFSSVFCLLHRVQIPKFNRSLVFLHVVGQSSLVSADRHSHLDAVACNGSDLVQHDAQTVQIVIQHLQDAVDVQVGDIVMHRLHFQRSLPQ